MGSSTLMYQIEHAENEAFDSVVAAMWWSVTALTTVGYGDFYPQTPLGKVVGSVVAFIGVGLFALPAGILGSGFVETVQAEARAAQLEDEEEILNSVDENAEQLNTIVAELNFMHASAVETKQEVHQMQQEMRQAKDAQNQEMRQVMESLKTILANQALNLQQSCSSCQCRALAVCSTLEGQ